jgi:hypothetical protein
MSFYVNPIIALTCVMQNEISSHVNPNVVFISMPFWKIPSSIVPQIRHLTLNFYHDCSFCNLSHLPYNGNLNFMWELTKGICVALVD